MERSNQPPKPECCLQRGQEPESRGMPAPNDLREAYTGQKRGPQAGFASCLSNSASKCSAADGDGLGMPEPNTDRAVAGEALEGLPGSQSVARAAAAARNQGDPAGSRRTNYEGQAGRGVQRQEEKKGSNHRLCPAQPPSGLTVGAVSVKLVPCRARCEWSIPVRSITSWIEGTGARTFFSMMLIVRSCSRRWLRLAKRPAGRCMRTA